MNLFPRVQKSFSASFLIFGTLFPTTLFMTSCTKGLDPQAAVNKLAGTLAISQVAVNSVTQNSAVVSWTTNVAATSQVNYGIAESMGANVQSVTPTTSHSLSLTTLTSGTQYFFQAFSQASSQTATSSTQSFLTASANGAPSISQVTITNITQNSAVINWTTNVPATSQINYGTTSTCGTVTPQQTATNTSHSVTLTGLAGGTLYYFQVLSVAAGETAILTGSTFSTTNGSLLLTPRKLASGKFILVPVH